MLKADFHLHTHEDPKDGYRIKYTSKQIIDVASLQGYKVLAITNHDDVFFNEELESYARSLGIILISGIEKTVEGKHVLILNINKEDAEKINKLDDLKTARENGAFVIAPHPYFILSNCLGDKLLHKYSDCFDAVEYSSFFLNLINLNKPAVKFASNFKKPIIATSDSHSMHEFGNSYTLVDSIMEKEHILEALRQGNIKIKTSPVTLLSFFRTLFSLSTSLLRKS